jgi:peptidoglycan/LPS O-acetylase OafA/YrhL
LGVYLFFGISGILITTRILEEESLCGFFDIKKFYVRRIFRIQPAAWVYLAVVGGLMAAGFITTQWRHWLGALGTPASLVETTPI